MRCPLIGRECRWVVKSKLGILRCRVCGCTIRGMQITGKSCPLGKRRW